MIDTLEGVVSKPARDVCARLQRAGHEAYVVGGCVRDALIGRAVEDWDVTTDALPEQVMKIFRRTIPTGVEHGTVTVLVDHVPVEVTTYRGEGAYSDARRPDSVTFGVPLEEDLARRDFVINAMAYDPHARVLVDPFGGAEDLRARLLRAVGDAAERFAEDGLRVMRAVRFVATLEFDLDPATEAAIPGALQSLAKVSVERVRVELLKLLGARQPSRGLTVAERTGVLGQILPERTDQIEVVDRIAGDAVLRFAALVAHLEPGTVGEVCRRLRLSNHERKRIVHAVEASRFDYDASWSDGDVRRFVALARRDGLADVFALRDAVSEPAPELRARAETVVAAGDPLYANELALSGADVMRVLGLGPGREVGLILARLLESVLDDPSLNEAPALTTIVKSLGDDME